MSTSLNYNELDMMLETESEEQKQARLARVEIAKCKAELATTDYIALKLAEVYEYEEEYSSTKERYAKELARRAELRARINELEAKYEN